MTAAPSVASAALSLLARLYLTGQNSDLIIRCPKPGSKHESEFLVHKCILYQTIPALKAHEFHNHQYTFIRRREPTEVVDVVLRHVYKLPLVFVPYETDTEEELREKASLENVDLAIAVFKAVADEEDRRLMVGGWSLDDVRGKTQFVPLSLLSLMERVIGNSLHRIVHRTFIPEPIIPTARTREAEAKLPEDMRQCRHEERKLEAEKRASERPLVDFIEIVLAVNRKSWLDEFKPFRIAAVFLLATRMPKVMNCAEAVTVLKDSNITLYRMVMKFAFAWLELAKKGDSEEERRKAAGKLFEMCAKWVGGEWTEKDFENGLYLPGLWGEGKDPWRFAVLEGEEFDV